VRCVPSDARKGGILLPQLYKAPEPVGARVVSIKKSIPEEFIENDDLAGEFQVSAMTCAWTADIDHESLFRSR